MMMDFIEQHSLDPEVIIDYADNYYNFLVKAKHPVPSLTEYELAILSMLSKEILNGKRLHEVILVDLLLTRDSVEKEEFIQALKDHGTYFDAKTIESVERIFSLEFHVTNDKNKFKQKAIIECTNNRYSFNEELRQSLQDSYYNRLCSGYCSLRI